MSESDEQERESRQRAMMEKMLERKMVHMTPNTMLTY
jgi:hypothetical protein